MKLLFTLITGLTVAILVFSKTEHDLMVRCYLGSIMCLLGVIADQIKNKNNS